MTRIKQLVPIWKSRQDAIWFNGDVAETEYNGLRYVIMTRGKVDVALYINDRETGKTEETVQATEADFAEKMLTRMWIPDDKTLYSLIDRKEERYGKQTIKMSDFCRFNYWAISVRKDDEELVWVMSPFERYETVARELRDRIALAEMSRTGDWSNYDKMCERYERNLQTFDILLNPGAGIDGRDILSKAGVTCDYARKFDGKWLIVDLREVRKAIECLRDNNAEFEIV